MALVMSVSNRSGCTARHADLQSYDGVTAESVPVLLRLLL
jgi:hypothetical protein